MKWRNNDFIHYDIGCKTHDQITYHPTMQFSTYTVINTSNIVTYICWDSTFRFYYAIFKMYCSILPSK